METIKVIHRVLITLTGDNHTAKPISHEDIEIFQESETQYLECLYTEYSPDEYAAAYEKNPSFFDHYCEMCGEEETSGLITACFDDPNA